MDWTLFTAFDVALCVLAALLLVAYTAGTEGAAPLWRRLAALALAAVYFVRAVSPFHRDPVDLTVPVVSLLAIIVLALRTRHVARAGRGSPSGGRASDRDGPAPRS